MTPRLIRLQSAFFAAEWKGDTLATNSEKTSGIGHSPEVSGRPHGTSHKKQGLHGFQEVETQEREVQAPASNFILGPVRFTLLDVTIKSIQTSLLTYWHH